MFIKKQVHVHLLKLKSNKTFILIEHEYVYVTIGIIRGEPINLISFCELRCCKSYNYEEYDYETVTTKFPRVCDA